MRLARYWSRQVASAADERGRPVSAAARGWSDASIEDAAAKARAIAQRVADLIAGGRTRLERYQYGERPIPEPLLQEFVSASGSLPAGSSASTAAGASPRASPT